MAGTAASIAGSRGHRVRSRKVYWGRYRVCPTIPARHGFDSSDALSEPTLRNSSMNIKAILAANGRDVRPDLFLGIANWFILLDHIPNNVVNWITIRNYGFSGAADLFIFISGYTAAIVYTQMMLERGFVVAATRIFKRVWQLYVAYVVLFAIYTVTIGDVAARYAAPDIIYEFNVAGLVDHPIRTVGHGLLLQSKALNLDVLPLYIVLMATLLPVLWMMLRKPDLRWPDLLRSILLRVSSSGICRRFRMEAGISTRFAGSCFLCLAPGSRSAGQTRFPANAAQFRSRGSRFVSGSLTWLLLW
jgi:hypothetical protein